LRLVQTRFQSASHASETELMQRVLEFGDVHDWGSSSLVFSAMKSR
jgi:hypothetical protein